MYGNYTSPYRNYMYMYLYLWYCIIDLFVVLSSGYGESTYQYAAYDGQCPRPKRQAIYLPHPPGHEVIQKHDNIMCVCLVMAHVHVYSRHECMLWWSASDEHV